MRGAVLERQAATYLWQGYLPPVDIPDWFYTLRQAVDVHGDYSPSGAAVRLDGLFDRVISTAPKPHIVPISGGWDSRVILGALAERSTDILTVTVGSPGQLDYEWGARVAKAAAVKHSAVSLQVLKLEWNELKKVAQRMPWTYMPDAYFISAAYQEVAREVERGTIWSGFLGDPLTGGHYREPLVEGGADQARARFFAGQRRFKDDSLVKRPGLPPYPPAPSWWTAFATEEEFLDFCVRQRGCIAPIVLGQEWRGWQADQGEYRPGLRVLAPFADAEWAAYWLRAPRKSHEHQRLYRQMGAWRFPDLFALPSKHGWGLRSNRIVARVGRRAIHSVRNRLHRRFPCLPIRSRLADNYLDFQSAFREREDYIQVMEKALQILSERQVVPWMDTEGIWRDHQRGIRDYQSEMRLLLGLAVNLEAENSETPTAS